MGGARPSARPTCNRWNNQLFGRLRPGDRHLPECRCEIAGRPVCICSKQDRPAFIYESGRLCAVVFGLRDPFQFRAIRVYYTYVPIIPRPAAHTVWPMAMRAAKCDLFAVSGEAGAGIVALLVAR